MTKSHLTSAVEDPAHIRTVASPNLAGGTIVHKKRIIKVNLEILLKLPKRRQHIVIPEALFISR